MRATLNINGQRLTDPGRFVNALGDAVVTREITMRTLKVSAVLSLGQRVTFPPQRGATHRRHRSDRHRRLVVATGGAPLAFRGRLAVGYSFTVPVDHPVPGPIYLPDVRVACTPYQGALRVWGAVGAARATRRSQNGWAPSVASAKPLLDGVRSAERSDIWVGPRPGPS